MCSVYSIIMTVNCSCISSSHCLLSFSCHCGVLTASVHCFYCYYVFKNIFCTVTEPNIPEFTMKDVLTYTIAKCCSLITEVLHIDNGSLTHKQLECSH